MLRHAYLIIAHNNFEILRKQMLLLDSENTDFYIHIDSKTKDFDFEAFSKVPEKSKVFYTERTDVQWGGYSQINCELVLLKFAVPGHYDYYHLLSGVDMPVKSRKHIESFFEQHCGKEFICFRENPNDHFRLRSRYMGHHFAYDSPFDAKFNETVKLVNRAVCVATPRKHYFPKDAYRYGSNWFSITDAFANYVISQEPLIRKQFRHTCCCDEIFLQTLCFNSPFKDNVYAGTGYSEFEDGCLRHIDFNRGRPYTFRKGDIDELINLPDHVLFARKFDYREQPEIVDGIEAFLKEIQR